MNTDVVHHRLEIENAPVDVFVGGDAEGSRPVVAAAHPTDAFGEPTVSLFAGLVRSRAVCIHAPLQGPHDSLEAMVDRIEQARRELALPRWVFWGMSGGGWLAQIYAHRHPEALLGIVIESACACFRERLADPDCVLSPSFPAWREGLGRVGLLGEAEHAAVRDAALEWEDVEGVGRVLRQHEGPAVLVSPTPIATEMEQAMPRLLCFDARPWLGNLSVPTLVLCGDADPVVPVRHARAVHEAVRGSTLVVVAGGGHVPSTTRADEITRAFDHFVR